MQRKQKTGIWPESNLLIRKIMNFKVTRIAAIFLLISPGAISQEVLTLRQAVGLGLANNYSILLQKNEARIAANNNTTGNAGFWPSVTLGTSQTNTISNTHQEQFSGTVKDVSNAKNRNFNAGIQANWTIFDGFSMFVNKKMLNVYEELGENGTRIVMEGFVTDISELYYGIIQYGKLIQVAKDALDLSIQRKRIAEAKLSLGAGSQLMLMQSTVDLNADSTRLIQQSVTLDNMKADFNRLLGRDAETPFIINDSIGYSGLTKPDSIFRQANEQNSQLLAARLRQDLSRLEVSQARAGRYPQISLNAGYNYSTLNSATGFLQYNRSYGLSYGFSLSYTLFNGFNADLAIKNAKILMNSGELETRNTELELKNTLLKLYNEWNANQQIVGLQRTNVQVARENVKIAFEKYQIGSINDIELREIQRKLIEAEYQLIASQYEVKKAEIEIRRYCGQALNGLAD